MDLIRLRELREARKVTQQNVADAVGLSVGRYRNYELLVNQPDPDTILSLAHYFDVSVDYLLNDSDIPVRLDDKDRSIFSLIKNLSPENKELFLKVSPSDVELLRLIHGLPEEHKDCLLKIKPADVEILNYLKNLSDHPTPYFIEGHLIGIPKNLTVDEVNQVKAFLDFVSDQHEKREKQGK